MSSTIKQAIDGFLLSCLEKRLTKFEALVEKKFSRRNREYTEERKKAI